jgi:hypothetical protein
MEDRAPLVTPTPLEFGVAYHRAMQAMYDPKHWDETSESKWIRASMEFEQACEEQKKEFVRVTEQYGLSDEQEKDYEESKKLGLGMLKWYAQYHLSKFLRPYAVEVKFRVPLLDDEGNQLRCKCERCHDKWQLASVSQLIELGTETWIGLPLVYEGRIDAIMIDEKGNYWILDWKTTARMMSEDADIALELDDQVASYCWAIMIQMGLAVRGFIFVELKKAFPQPPTLNKVVRLGCSYSVSKNQDTDYRTFLRTVKRKDPQAYQAGLYNEYLEWLKEAGPRFIQVHTVYKSRTDLINTGRDIVSIAQEMLRSDLPRYRNTSRSRFVCVWCPFQGPCIDKQGGRDYMYALDTMYEKRPRYYEQLLPSTDRK